MRCSEIRRKLSAFSDGELSETVETLISEHLKSCDSCQKELEGLAQVYDILSVMDEVEVSPFFMTRLKQRIADQEAIRRVHFPSIEWIRRAVVPVGATALILISFLIGNGLGKAMYKEQVVRMGETDTKTIDALGFASLDEFPEGSLGWAYSNLLAGGE